MAGKMKNCSSCGKVFVSINNSRICADCREKEEKWEKEIIEYVRDHPKSQNSFTRARNAAPPSRRGSTATNARRRCATN